jgi:hypothetical protein
MRQAVAGGRGPGRRDLAVEALLPVPGDQGAQSPSARSARSGPSAAAAGQQRASQSSRLPAGRRRRGRAPDRSAARRKAAGPAAPARSPQGRTPRPARRHRSASSGGDHRRVGLFDRCSSTTISPSPGGAWRAAGRRRLLQHGPPWSCWSAKASQLGLVEGAASRMRSRAGRRPHPDRPPPARARGPGRRWVEEGAAAVGQLELALPAARRAMRSG